MRTKTLLFLFVAALLVSMQVAAQSKGGVTPSATPATLTADSLASGNWKNVLTSFFQLSFNDLTSKSKSVSFTANPYAVMLRADSTVALDTNYVRLRPWRKLNFNFALTLDTSYRFHGFVSGVKYALIDKRDSTISRWLFNQTAAVNAKFTILFNALLRYETIYYRNPDKAIDSLLANTRYPMSMYHRSVRNAALGIARRNKLNDIQTFLEKSSDSVLAKHKGDFEAANWTVLADSLNAYTPDQLALLKDSILTDHKAFSLIDSAFFRDTLKTFKSLDTTFQQVAKKVAADSGLTSIVKLLNNPNERLAAEMTRSFDSLKAVLQNQWLWTVGVSDTTYPDQFLFSNIIANTELLKGMINPNCRTNLELDIKASMNWVDDSLTKGRNLQRSFLRFEPGVNWVIKQKSNQQPFLELAFSGQYNHFFSGWYSYEQQDRVYFNGTLRLRIFNDIWIPLQFSYDPKSGNVFGFLNVTTNFNALGSLLKPSKGG